MHLVDPRFLLDILAERISVITYHLQWNVPAETAWGPYWETMTRFVISHYHGRTRRPEDLP